MEEKENIEKFLEEFKIMMKVKGFMPVPRDKYTETLSELNISPNEAKEAINNLCYLNYVSGPKQDRNNEEKQVWIFGCTIMNREIYIKLSNDFTYKAKCISFHISERKMVFPYLEQEGHK